MSRFLHSLAIAKIRSLLTVHLLVQQQQNAPSLTLPLTSHTSINTMTQHVKNNRDDFYMAVADSGTTKHLVDQDDEFVKSLKNLRKATGKVTGIGAHLVQYTGVGERAGQMFTIADGLKCFLYSLVQFGEKGVLAVADWDTQTGENLSFILNENTGTAYPMIQLKPGA